MSTLHDPATREALKARLRGVRADSPRKWGEMSPDQMMWHLCAGMEMCMGVLDISREKNPLPIPLPRFLVRWMILGMPWPRGAPTLSVAYAGGKQFDLEAERARCLRIMDEFAARPLNGPWPYHPFMGQLTGEQYSMLQIKHINHHLAQFSA